MPIILYEMCFSCNRLVPQHDAAAHQQSEEHQRSIAVDKVSTVALMPTNLWGVRAEENV